MGIRLQSAFRSSNDDYYKIEIHDSAYSGAALDVNVGGNGFTLTHDGETDAVYSTIIGSSVSVTIYNDSVGVDAFRAALLNAQDKQFHIRIERAQNPALGFKERVESDGGTFEGSSCLKAKIDALGGVSEPAADQYNLFWIGYITQDLIQEADESKPSAIQISAADGISLLSTFDYQFSLAQSFQKDMRDVVCDILDDSGIADLFESNETMLTTVVNYYADEHTYSVSTDPMTVTKFDLKAFTTYTTNAGREYTSALQVIREMAVIMGARFYFSNGSFRFEQIRERDEITIREFYYLNTGTANGNANKILDTTVDQQSAHRSGGLFRYLPAVKRVNLTQQKVSAANLIGGVVEFPADEIDVGIVPSANNGRILLNMRSAFQTFIANPLSGTSTPVFAVTIRLEPSDGTANQYWTNSLVSGFTSFGVGSWSTTLGTYKWAATTVGRQTSSTTISVHSMATGPLPKDGEIYIDITILGFYDAQGSSTSFFTGGNTFNWKVFLNSARYENDNDSATIVESLVTSINGSTNIGSNIAVDLDTTRLGDGPGASGSLYAYTGSAWTQSTGWRIGNSGSYTDIAELTVKEILALQKTVVHRFEGTIINGGIFSNRFSFDVGDWLPLRSTFVANKDELEIEAFLVRRNIIDISTTATDVGSDDDAGFVGHYSGGYTNSASGVIAGMVIDIDNASVGPFEQTASGGEINGTMNVTGDATLAGALGVTGDISGSDISASNDITATGNVSGTDVNASNNITASNQLTAANASLDNFVTKTAIIGSTALVDSFKTRVENDGGTFEAFDAVLDAITPLLIGTAEKSAVIYGDTSVETLDASKSITASGNVSATNLNASNNATITGVLSVSGASLLQSTGVTNFTHTGNQIENIRDIEHEPGDVYSINDSDFMIFNTWSPGAANGSSTINLPAAADHQGRLLRFKSDGTISSNHEIKLVPDGGDTIDGSAEFSFSRDYDGVMIMAHNGEWFIVQRKAK